MSQVPSLRHLAAAGASSPRSLPSEVSNCFLNSAMASAMAVRVSSDILPPSLMEVMRPCSLRCRYSRSSFSKRRMSATGTSSILPVVPAHTETTWSSVGHRLVLRLLEQLDQALTALQLGLRRGVQVGTEGGERLQLTVLGEVEAEPAGHLLHRLVLGGATDAGDRDTDVQRRTLAGVEQVGLQEALAVGDGDDVGRDERRDVVGLGLDDRQTGHRAGAQVVGELRAALQQTGVQVEDVTRVGLTARRAAQQQGHGAVGVGLLREVVEDDEDVLALVHPLLADGRTGVRRQVLEAGRVGRRGGDDGRVLQRAGLFQRAAHGGDGGALLADGDVDAADLLLRVAGAPVVALVDDRVDGQGGLAGLAVTDDQLTLATADRGHRVDGLVAGLHRLVHRLTGHDARSLQLQGAAAGRLDLAEAVDRVAERVDDAAEVALADRDGEDLTGTA